MGSEVRALCLPQGDIALIIYRQKEPGRVQVPLNIDTVTVQVRVKPCLGSIMSLFGYEAVEFSARAYRRYPPSFEGPVCSGFFIKNRE